MTALDFWYEFGSTYSYPAAMRIERLAEAAHVEVRWRPFLLGPIFKAYGWNDSPFNIYSAKGRYMWRDLQRICEAEGLPLKLPPVQFPQNGLKAARLALVGERQGWTPAFSRAVFVANYAEQKDISDKETLGAILRGLGVDAEAALVAANAAETKEALKTQTAEAGSRGLFGAPPHHRRRIVLGQPPARSGTRLGDTFVGRPVVRQCRTGRSALTSIMWRPICRGA